MSHEIESIDGLYTGGWRIHHFDLPQGPDPSRLCLMLPGQGAARPGMMGELLEASSEFAACFDEADAVAARHGLPPASGYVRNEVPSDPAELAVVRILALCILTVGLHRSIRWSLPAPALVTGFSMGEYPALAISGVLDLATVAELTVLRDQCCPQPHSAGVMLAAAASSEEVGRLLEGIPHWPAVLCTPNQTSVSLPSDRAAEALRRFAAADVRATDLEAVPQPYHSPLLEPSSQRFREAMANLEPPAIQAPQLPMLSSVTGQIIDHAPSWPELQDLLARQLLTPVNWISQVETVWKHGCGSFLELGPGRTLSKLTAAVLGELPHRVRELEQELPVAGNGRSAESAARAASSPLARPLRAVVARLTGFELESISFEDRFQEDLGIDSLKKIDLVVRFLDEAGLEVEDAGGMAEAQSLAELVEAIERSSSPAGEAAAAPSDDLVARLAFDQVPTPAVEAPPFAGPVVDLQHLVENGLEGLQGTVAVRIDQPPWLQIGDKSHLHTAEDLRMLNHLCRALRTPIPGEKTLLMVTGPQTRAVASGAAAALVSLSLEVEDLRVREVEIAGASLGETGLRELLGYELVTGEQPRSRWYEGVRSVPVPRAKAEADEQPPLPEASVVLAVGGATGIGLELVRHLVSRSRLHLWLAGRRKPELVAGVIDEFKSQCLSVHYNSIDVRSRDEVAGWAKAAAKEHGRVDLALGSAGVQHSAQLAEHDDDAIDSVLTTKILGAQHLAEACDLVGAARCLHFGSIVGRWGNHGQAPYAAANRALSALCEGWARRDGGCRHTAVEWPAWAGVGMTAQPGIEASLRQRGMVMLGPARGGRLLDEILADNEAVITVAAGVDAVRSVLALAGLGPFAAVLGDIDGGGTLRRIDLEHDSWLHDHVVGGRPLLPAAFCVAQALAVAWLTQGPDAVVQDFRMLSPLVVDDPVDLRLRLRPVETGLLIEGRTRSPIWQALLPWNPPDAETAVLTRISHKLPAAADDAPCPAVFSRIGMLDGLSSTTARPSGRKPLWTRRLPALATKPGEKCGLNEAAKESGGEWQQVRYGDGILFHGPAFQVLSERRGGAHGMIAKLPPSPIPVTGAEIVDRVLRAVDGALQLAALLRLERLGSDATAELPVAIDRIEASHSRLWPDSVRLATANGQSSGWGDAMLEDSRKQSLIRLLGISGIEAATLNEKQRP